MQGLGFLGAEFKPGQRIYIFLKLSLSCLIFSDENNIVKLFHGV